METSTTWQTEDPFGRPVYYKKESVNLYYVMLEIEKGNEKFYLPWFLTFQLNLGEISVHLRESGVEKSKIFCTIGSDFEPMVELNG